MTVPENAAQRLHTQGVAVPSMDEETLEQLIAAVKAKPCNQRLAVRLTDAFTAMASPNMAVEFWHNAVMEKLPYRRDLAPFTIALSQLLHCFRVQGKTEEGIRLLKSMTVNNSLFAVWQPLAKAFAFVAQGDTTGAFELARTFMNNGDLDGMIECCMEGIRSNRYSTGLGKLLVDAFISLGDVDGAVQFWEQAISYDPFNVRFRKQLKAATTWKSKIEPALEFQRRCGGVEHSANSTVSITSTL